MKTYTCKLIVMFFVAALFAPPRSVAQGQLQILLPVPQSFGKVRVGTCGRINIGLRARMDTVTPDVSLRGMSPDSGAFKIVFIPTLHATETMTFDTILPIEYCPDHPAFDTTALVFVNINGMRGPFPISLRAEAVGASVIVAAEPVVAPFGSTQCAFRIRNSSDSAECVRFDVRQNGNRYSVSAAPGSPAISRTCDAATAIAALDSADVTLDIADAGTAGADSLHIVLMNAMGYPLDSIRVLFHPPDDSATFRFRSTRVGAKDSEQIVVHNWGNNTTLAGISLTGADARAFTWRPIAPLQMNFPLVFSAGDSIVLQWIFAPQIGDTGAMIASRLVATDTAGGVRILCEAHGAAVDTTKSAVQAGALMPGVLSLGAPSPNPASGAVRIPFSGVRGRAEVHLTNDLGVELAVFPVAKGSTQGLFQLDTRNIPSGYYCCRLITEHGSATTHVMVVR